MSGRGCPQRTREALKAEAEAVKLGNPRWNESVEAACTVRSAKASQADSGQFYERKLFSR